MDKNEIIETVLGYAARLKGMGYSQKRRYRLFKGGSADCSSFVFAAFLSAGIVLKTRFRQNRVSCRQVYSEGFELVFPKSYADIGKYGHWSQAGFYRTFDWRRGDVIFYCNDDNTRRKNKITHVALCVDRDRIIHDGNNDEKTCVKDISYGDGRIVAVIRIKEDIKPRGFKRIGAFSLSRTDIMRMQLLLNIKLPDAGLNCLGFLTPGTLKALSHFRRSEGMTAKPVCDGPAWRALTKNDRV